MKKFRDEDKYTTVKQSRIIQPIMDKLGIGEDRIERCRDLDFNFRTTYHYRLDTLLWVLRNSGYYEIFTDLLYTSTSAAYYKYSDNYKINEELLIEIKSIFLVLIISESSKEAIIAATKLIKLLDNNDLLEAEDEE